MMGLFHQTRIRTERMTSMTRKPSRAEADNLLLQLCTLVIARKQARWQWANCADEHAHKWTRIVDELDTRINRGEQVIAALMEIHGFRVKREVVE